MFLMQTQSQTVLKNKLVAARVAHSTAKKALMSFPIGTREDLEIAERAAYAVVVAFRDSVEASLVAKPVVLSVRAPVTCCGAGVPVRGTFYMAETNCVCCGNRTVGTCD
jgi:hypothetical protein